MLFALSLDICPQLLQYTRGAAATILQILFVGMLQGFPFAFTVEIHIPIKLIYK